MKRAGENLDKCITSDRSHCIKEAVMSTFADCFNLFDRFSRFKFYFVAKMVCRRKKKILFLA